MIYLYLRNMYVSTIECASNDNTASSIAHFSFSLTRNKNIKNLSTAI